MQQTTTHTTRQRRLPLAVLTQGALREAGVTYHAAPPTPVAARRREAVAVEPGAARRVAYVESVERRGGVSRHWHGSTGAAVVGAVELMERRRGNGGYAYSECRVVGPARSVVSEGGMVMRREAGRGWQRRLAARLAASRDAMALERQRRARELLERGAALPEPAAAPVPPVELRPDAERAAWIARHGIPAPVERDS